MKIKRIKRILIISQFLLAVGINICNAQPADDSKAFSKLRTELSAAFANGDPATISAYHHPEVVKALNYNKFLVGRNAVINDISTNLQYFNFVFKEHRIENFVIEGDMATEISTFTMDGIPKGDSKPFTFKGRSIVVYIRYTSSPSGWAIFREMVQPESN